MSIKIGRNEPCPCGSGNKYKKCCIDKDQPKPRPARISMPQSVLEEFQAKAEKTANWNRLFGNIKEPIAANFKGYRFIAIQNRLHYGTWKTFTDFLYDYLKIEFGKEWWIAQFADKEKKLHPVCEWAKGFTEHTKTHGRNEGEINSVIPNGSMMAYLTLAFDLYVLRNNAEVKNELLKRLRDPGQFKGARYELLVASVCRRAGMSLRFETEKGAKTKHPEFIATLDGIDFDVEAKKRNRMKKINPEEFEKPGVRLDVRDLLGNAVQKKRDRPYLVFLDIDAPPIVGDPFQKPWTKELYNAQEEAGAINENQTGKINCLIFTNYPIDYHPSDQPFFSYIFSEHLKPQHQTASRNYVAKLMDALDGYGNVPSLFDDINMN